MPEKKKTAFEKVQDNRKELVNKIIENMKKGHIWEAGWNINALRSQNPISGAKYKGINKLSLGYVIADKEYKDPRFITFKQAQEKGWSVKKGEHGYMCEYWIWTKKEEKINEKGEKEKIEVPLDKPMISYFTVFNMEQIKGDYPKFELPKLSHDEMLKIADDFIASSRCPIKETAQSRAYYNASDDRIILPLRDSFNSSEDFLETALHEMAHSTGKELGRKFGIGQLSPAYAKEELVAELSAMFIKAELGLEFSGKHFENHTAYLESWSKMLKEDYNELYKASKEADKATELLMDRYREYLKTKENIVEKSEIEIPKETNKENLKNTNELIFDLKKYEIEKNISEMKNINKVNEHGNKDGLWYEIKEKSIIECKYNNGIKSGKFTETFLTNDENSSIKTKGMYRNGKLSGEIISLFKDDSIASIKNYKAGVILSEKNYYRNGNLKDNFSYDKTNYYEFKKFYENGNLKESLEILNKTEKNFKIYDIEGNIEKNIIFDINKQDNSIFNDKEISNNSWEEKANENNSFDLER